MAVSLLLIIQIYYSKNFWNNYILFKILDIIILNSDDEQIVQKLITQNNITFNNI